MEVTLSEMTTLVRLWQAMNKEPRPEPMIVTLLGMVTLVRLLHQPNA